MRKGAAESPPVRQGDHEVNRMEIERLVEDLAGPIAESEGLVLVDVEFVREGGRRFLRVYVDKPGGVTLDDCGTFSRVLGSRLDQEDPIPESYYLEVASPGLDRPIRKDREFELFKGRRVAVRTFAPPEGAVPGQRSFRGELIGLVDGRVAVRDDDGRMWEIPRALVSGVRLDPVF